jgi:hypothetical protein
MFLKIYVWKLNPTVVVLRGEILPSGMSSCLYKTDFRDTLPPMAYALLSYEDTRLFSAGCSISHHLESRTGPQQTPNLFMP